MFFHSETFGQFSKFSEIKNRCFLTQFFMLITGKISKIRKNTSYRKKFVSEGLYGHGFGHNFHLAQVSRFLFFFGFFGFELQKSFVYYLSVQNIDKKSNKKEKRSVSNRIRTCAVECAKFSH